MRPVAWAASCTSSSDSRVLTVSTLSVNTAGAACGTGGRKREFVGDCWDHFAVIYYFPNDLVLSFISHQTGYGYDDIMCRVYGLKGTADTHYFGNVTVKAKEFRSDGQVGNLYSDGVETNIATFHDSITRGNWANPTVAPSVRSNLTTILGRMAAYTGLEITWDQAMNSQEKLVPDQLDWKMKLDFPPMAMPGVTKFI